MEAAVFSLLEQGIAKSTAPTYSIGQHHYLQFCQLTNSLPVPASEWQLMKFAEYLSQKGLKWQSIKTYLAGTRHYLMLRDLTSPFVDERLPRLQLLLKGIKRQSASCSIIRPRLPISPSMLDKCFQVLAQEASNPDHIMLWAAMNLCFFGFLRSGEICCPSTSTFDPTWHLCVSDVAVDSISNTRMIYVTIKASKTDPFRLGVTISVGRTDNRVCPVKALLPYLALRGSQMGPLFIFTSGQFLTRSRFVAEVRAILQKAGFDQSKYAGHSFRIGAATTAAKAGIQDNIIQTLGRWKSSAYQAYIRLPRETLHHVSSSLVSQQAIGQELA